MKTNLLFLGLLLTCLGLLFSCGRETSENPLSHLSETLSKDADFTKLVEIENQRILYAKQNHHNQKEVNWKLINDPAERAKINNNDELKAFLTKAGMKNIDTYFDLLNQYGKAMRSVKKKFPELSTLSNEQFDSIISSARNSINKQNNQ